MKKLDKINYIKYNFLISYRNVTAIKPVIKKTQGMISMKVQKKSQNSPAIRRGV